MLELVVLGIVFFLLWSKVYATPAEIDGHDSTPVHQVEFGDRRGCLYSSDFVPSRDLPQYNVL